jgi:transposase
MAATKRLESGADGGKGKAGVKAADKPKRAGFPKVPKKQTPDFTVPELELIAWLRFAEGMSWERIAQRVGKDRRTLYNWRERGEAWDAARNKVIEEMKHQGEPTAWGCLLRQAAHNDVAAAKEILNRTAGAVVEKRELSGPNGGAIPFRREDYADLSPEELLSIARSGLGHAGDAGGGDGPG